MTVATWFVATRLIIFALGVVGAGSFVNQHTQTVLDNTAALNPGERLAPVGRLSGTRKSPHSATAVTSTPRTDRPPPATFRLSIYRPRPDDAGAVAVVFLDGVRLL
jgi:hypothetical protein